MEDPPEWQKKISTTFRNLFAAPAVCGDSYSAALLGAAPALLAQPHLLGQLRAGGRVIRRDHRVIGAQTPFLAVLLRRHVVLRAQMPLE